MLPVSIVVPTCNQARFLPACLDSIWFQDFSDIEIIVVNDGSSDDTKEVLDRYREAISQEQVSFSSDYDEKSDMLERTWHRRYPEEGRRLVCINHDGTQGLSATLNAGFQAARGEYCTFIASDAVLLPSMVSDLLLALERNGADFAYADMHIVNDEGRILQYVELPDYSFENAFCHWRLCCACMLYRRELHDKYGYYDPACASQDHEMYLRFAMAGARFVHVPKVLAQVRSYARDQKVDNLSAEEESQRMESSKHLVKKAREFVGRNPE